MSHYTPSWTLRTLTRLFCRVFGHDYSWRLDRDRWNGWYAIRECKRKCAESEFEGGHVFFLPHRNGRRKRAERELNKIKAGN